MEKRWKYVDIHTHIVPGVDDGSSRMEESMRMVKMAYDEGVRVIVATPHYGLWNPTYDREKALRACHSLRDNVARLYSDMKVYTGNEIYYSPGIVEDLDEKRALTLGGTDYVLMEFSVNEERDAIVNAVRELVMAGYRPILAHVERYEKLRRDVEEVRRLMDAGAYIQINTNSFMGSRRDRRTAWCAQLLRERCVHFVASDCHNCGSRKPLMETAVRRMIAMSDVQTVKRIVHTNVMRLVKNQYI